MRRQYQYMDNGSGVGVIDKAVAVLTALEQGPTNLAGLVNLTGLPRPTAHRLALALEHHRLIERDRSGRFALGPRLPELSAAAGEDRLLAASAPILTALRNQTGESAQLYKRHGNSRICVAAADRTTGLRDSVPVGSRLPMTAGSAAQVLLAWEPQDRIESLLREAHFSASELVTVRKRGWAQSVGQREAGVASVSAPIYGPGKRVVAAIGVSGPIERLSRTPGRLHAAAVMRSAIRLSQVVTNAG